MSDAVSCDHEGQGSVQVLMDDHLASGQGGRHSARSICMTRL
jgi:hypothetical protein